MFEILLDNKNGNVWDISEIVTDLKWKTSRIGRPGSFEFTLIKNALYQASAFQYNNGNIIRFKYKNNNVFYGYIFEIDDGKDENVRILAYDQIRYLLAADTYVFTNISASDVLRKIASDFKLKLGRIDDTVFRIPTLVEDGQKLLDIIDKALTLTLVNTNRNYFLYDDFGALSIRNVEDMLLIFMIGDESLMYDFNMKTSIDNDTYNQVKLYQNNEKSGKREVYIAQDSNNIDDWGILQLYQSVDENLNVAQIKELLDTLITIKNRESKTLKLSAVGDIRVRAGSYLRILIQEYNINQPFLVDECIHSFNGTDHTMSLELKVIA